MKCPFCQHDNDKVIDSRSYEDGFIIKRRRQCQVCEKRFTTYEQVVELDIRVIKRDGAREPFDPDKIRRGIERACWKRPIPTERVEQTSREILQEIYLTEGGEIESNSIGEIVLRKLLELDPVAFIRFASVYRQYRDVQDFLDELKPLIKGDPSKLFR
jgi:transcriptional repressor NrdR